MGALHQPQLAGRTGRLRIQRLPVRFRGRCGWSSADTAALLSYFGHSPFLIGRISNFAGSMTACFTFWRFQV